MAQWKRRGEKSKCPACGQGLDEDAYHCPECRVYFCSKCRSRVGKHDAQYQCVSRSCSCYGKPVCSHCSIEVKITGRVNTHLIEVRYWMFVFVVAGVTSTIAWYQMSHSL